MSIHEVTELANLFNLSAVKSTMHYRTLCLTPILLLAILLFTPLASSQAAPEAVENGFDNPRAEEIAAITCPVDEEREARIRERGGDWEQELETRRRYQDLLPLYFSSVPLQSDDALLMPVEGVTVGQVTDTWGAARSEGRTHEGQDIFAPRGTPVYSATQGYVYRIGDNPLGGNVVVVIGAGGIRYYYAHLDSFASDLREGQYVTAETLLGFVGNTGNAVTTPPHLHLGMYGGSYESCDWDAVNPYPFLVNR